MTQLLEIHPTHPQARLVAQVAECLRDGGIVAYPTDSSYALGCSLSAVGVTDDLRRLRGLRKGHLLTLLCASLAEMARYARVDNPTFRWLKPHVPGPYTFILRASGATPRRVQHDKRRTVGVRIPAHPLVEAVLASLDEPLVSTTLKLPGSDEPLTDPRAMRDALRGRVALIVDGGPGGVDSTTVVDLTTAEPSILRVGCGPPEPFAEAAR